MLNSAFGLLSQPFCSIRVQYSGPPGSVIGEISSIEQKNDLVIDSRMRNEGDGWAGSGANPWHLDPDTESYAFLANMGDKPARIGYRVWADGQTYFLDSLELLPHETRMIDLRKLRDAQETDFMKHTIHAGATDGSVLWLRLDNVPVMGRVAAITRHGGVASSYDCCMCACPGQYEYTTVAPGTSCPISVGVGDQVNSTAAFIPACGGSQYYYNMTGSSSWSSTNTSVFTLNNTAPIGLLKAVGVGSALASAQGPTECNAWYMMGGVCQCSSNTQTGGSTSCSVKPTVQIVGGNNFAFESTDATVTQYNLEQAQGNPGGGQYSWSASPSRVSFNNPSASLVTLTGTSPSTALLDTTLTVNYTYNGQPATPATRAITVRIFKFLQQSGSTQVILLNGPSQYGYDAYAYYNLFSNPSGQQVPSGFYGMTTLELVTINSVTPSGTTVTLHQGNGATNANSQILDDLSLISNATLPSNLHINASQDLAVGGIYVRSNTLDYYPSGPTITNNGPYQ